MIPQSAVGAEIGSNPAVVQIKECLNQLEQIR